MQNYSLRQKLGALVYDFPLFICNLRSSSDPLKAPWIRIRNRNERLLIRNGRAVVQFSSPYTSDLYLSLVYPSVGGILMKKALKDWPIAFSEAPDVRGEVEVSFIIGHRGTKRLRHLLSTIGTIAAQRNVNVECIVVEQTDRSALKSLLPSWVRWIHTPIRDSQMPYCRSWAFNVGARLAHGKAIVLHDGDMLVPQDYADQVLQRIAQGYEVINLKRFIFRMSRAHTEEFFDSSTHLLNRPPELVLQNLLAGGSIALSATTYLEIAGFDENFIGWGGEDNEFWERAKSRSVWEFGYIPLVHLWHESQPEKRNNQETASLLKKRLSVPVSQRIEELRLRDFGNPSSGLDQDWQMRSLC